MNPLTPNPTLLDQMLYAWLAETDDHKFEQAFQRYYQGASPSVVRYVARCSSLADIDCEQIAVDALLKFFCRAGRDRRQAAAAVADALPQIQPLDLGAFHVRQVQRWTGEVEVFRHTSMTFQLPPQGPAERPWKMQIQALAEDIPPLQRQGLTLLEAMRLVCAALGDVSAGAANGNTGDAVELAEGQLALIRAFAASNSSLAAESRHPGVTRCVGGAWTVVDCLPALRIPTNGYLFDIAHSLYLDECKARGRKKRGGRGISTEALEADDPSHTLAPFDLDESASSDNGGDASRFAGAESRAHSGALAVDTTTEVLDADFCEQFFRYVSRSLDDAQEAYRMAASTGKAEAARKRLASISEKHARFMAVLTMRIEGQTQEAIGEALSLSRNQVKYVTEQAQDAYRQFCAAAMRSGHS